MSGISKLARKMKLSEEETVARIRARLDDPEAMQALSGVFQIDTEDDAEVQLFRDLLTMKLSGDEDGFREKAAELNLIGRMQKLGLLPS